MGSNSISQISGDIVQLPDAEHAQVEPKTLRYRLLHAGGAWHAAPQAPTQISTAWSWPTAIVTAWDRISAPARTP
jgi:hypothetical protein